VWRSDNGGQNWQVVSYDRNAMGRAHYYSHIEVAPGPGVWCDSHRLLSPRVSCMALVVNTFRGSVPRTMVVMFGLGRLATAIGAPSVS